MERREIVYSGRVQGVGFRASTRRIASKFDVTGWVRNEDDGSVRAEVQGETATVEAFLQAVRAQMRGFISHEHARYGLTIMEETQFVIQH